MKYPDHITIHSNINLYECVLRNYITTVNLCGKTANSIILHENEFFIKEFDGEKYVFFGYLVKLSECSYTEKEYPDDTVFNLKLQIDKGTDCFVSKYIYSGFTGYYNLNKVKTTKKYKKSFSFENTLCVPSTFKVGMNVSDGMVFLKDCKVVVEQTTPLTKTTVVPEWKKLINGSVFEFTEDVKAYTYNSFKRMPIYYGKNSTPSNVVIDIKKEIILEKNKKYKMLDVKFNLGPYYTMVEDKNGPYRDSAGTKYDYTKASYFKIEDEDGNIIYVIGKSVDKKHLKVISYPESYQFCIADASGKLYSDYTKEYNVTPKPIFGAFSKAKKFKDLSKLKASLMYLTGYTSFNESMEHDGFGEKILDIDPSWKAVKINKLTYEVIEEYDIYNWYNNLLRLRVLTEKFGSPVRTAYKQFEDGKIQDQYIVLINKKLKTDGDYENIDEKLFCDTKTKIIRCKSSIGILTDNISKACKMKLKGTNDIHILKLSNLEEYIEE